MTWWKLKIFVDLYENKVFKRVSQKRMLNLTDWKGYGLFLPPVSFFFFLMTEQSLVMNFYINWFVITKSRLLRHGIERLCGQHSICKYIVWMESYRSCDSVLFRENISSKNPHVDMCIGSNSLVGRVVFQSSCDVISLQNEILCFVVE